MNKMDLKDIFTGEVQSKTNKKVYIQALKSDFECIVAGKYKSYGVVFIYNEGSNREWKFNYKLFQNMFSSSLICIFVCDNEETFLEYHIINLIELLSINNIDVKDFRENREKQYLFNDEENRYTNNWKVFE